MGFLNGRVTYVRYRVGGDAPCRSARNSWSRSRPTPSASTGWATPTDGDHRRLGGRQPRPGRDLRRRQERPQRRPAPGHADRHRQDPGDLLRAYTRIETDARAQLNPSGVRHQGPEQEAKEAARARAEAEAADGRFRRRKHYPILWDGRVQRPLRRDGQRFPSSTASRRSSARRSTARWSRSPPAASPIRSPRRTAASAPSRTSPRRLPGRGRRPIRRSPGPAPTPPAATTGATSSSSGSGTPCRPTATPSPCPTARRPPSWSPRP